MTLARSIILGLLLLAWGAAVNGCMLAAAAPQIFPDCCEDSAATGDGNCSEGSCLQCVNLETGLATSLLQTLQFSEPVPREHVWQTKLLRLQAARPSANAHVTGFYYTPPERPLWHFVVRTALPVRGPSISSS